MKKTKSIKKGKKQFKSVSFMGITVEQPDDDGKGEQRCQATLDGMVPSHLYVPPIEEA